MKLVAMLQLYNEFENCHLIRCLENCAIWADEIFIYDDCSTDGSEHVYSKYTARENIIFGEQRNFTDELFHKKELLDLVLKCNPDWIGWIDGDAIFDKAITNSAKDMLKTMDDDGFDGVNLHNLNLWRHPAFYRTDNLFNNLYHRVFWKNNGNLHYYPSQGLHKDQFPCGMMNVFQLSQQFHLLHYGFASEEWIIRKYLTYKSYGQNGWALDRLVDEDNFVLCKVPSNLYPENNVPYDYKNAKEPTPLTYNKYRKFNSWEAYKDEN